MNQRLGVFDVTLIVMGGIVGAGIFMNPALVAQKVGTPGGILLAWLIGGAVALLGAFIYAELAARRPAAGGQYAYIREAFHPLLAFLYGWGLLLVVQSGGMAAVAMTFARYFLELTGVGLPQAAVAVLALAALTGVNCLGVRAGSNLQGVLMLTKAAAILMLVACGLLARAAPAGLAVAGPALAPASLSEALVPVLFAYGGWQTASFVTAELRHPERDLPRGLLFGVVGVVALYLGVNYVCVRVLGAAALAASEAPASEVMRLSLGPIGATLIAGGIAISTLGFLSQSILTAPRVYFAMARDGVFLESVGRLHPRTQAPVVAILLQGAVAAAIAVSGRYGQILSYVVAVDFIFFGLTALTLFVYRRRDPAAAGYRVPGHPWTTLIFTAACWLVASSAVLSHPRHAGLGLALLLTGVPVYFLWKRRA